MATRKYWIDKYYNNIQSAGEHNKAFSLEWFLSLPIRNRKIMLEEYKKPSALLHFRNKDLPIDSFIPECSDENLCNFMHS
jgi:hypothetical protein